MSQSPDRYSPVQIAALFDEMSATYGVVNLFASFGFTVAWRRVCAGRIPKAPGGHGLTLDLMTGMGENFGNIHARVAPREIVAIDLSTEMCKRAEANGDSLRLPVKVMKVDALASGLTDGCADSLFCTFGLKTLSNDQQAALAKEVRRLLKPGGVFSFIEISVPRNPLLKLFLLFYLRILIPVIGRLFLGNPANYRMLAFYTESFINCGQFVSMLEKEGLHCEPFDHFFGCATGVSGRR